MSPGNITRVKADSDKILLRWSDCPASPAVELPVELIAEDGSQRIVRAPVRLDEETPVTLLANEYMVNGIVRFCRADRNSYLITVSTNDSSDEQFETVFFHDPGSLAVDDFLTEEEEAKILESLQDSSNCLGFMRLSDMSANVRGLLSPSRVVQFSFTS
ncbi:MAG: hypothetical protein ACJ74Y_01270 [Bryobacteraceae bacterium]